jgi:hypothetical protein
VDSTLHHTFIVNSGDGAVLLCDTMTGAATIVARLGFVFSDSVYTLQGWDVPLVVDQSAHLVYTGEQSTAPGAGPYQVVALDARNGQVVRRYQRLPRPTELGLDTLHGRLIDAGLSALVTVDLRSGRVIGQLALGFPKSLVVDAQRGRALVFAQDSKHPGYPQLRVVDTETGWLVSSQVLGPAYSAPLGIVIDPSVGLAYTVLGSEHRVQVRSVECSGMGM